MKNKPKKRKPRSPDWTGQTFGRWTVLHRTPLHPDAATRNSQWVCRCLCGTERVVFAFVLRNGESQSCGCLSKELSTKRFTKHGEHQTRLYKAWTAMKQRCLNPNDPAYINYGGRGITIAQVFLDSFEALKAELGPKPSPKHTIERINNARGYEPGNIQWATYAQQRRNTRLTRFITYHDRTQPLCDWVTELGIPHATLWYRIMHWGVDRAFATPPRR
jgi:hypothetical protein